MPDLENQPATPDFLEMPLEANPDHADYPEWLDRARIWSDWNNKRVSLWGLGITDLSSIGPEPQRPWEPYVPPPPP